MSDKKILIVDDSFEFNFLLSSLFKFNKIPVTTETNPELALNKVKENEYDLLIVDYLMKEMNGIEFCEKVKEMNPYESKMIILTAKNLDSEELTQIHNLNLIYIKKPIMPNDLMKKVLEILEK